MSSIYNNDKFNELEHIYNQCLIDIKKQQDINDTLDFNLIGQFLIYSWHGVLARRQTSETLKPSNGFKAFILQQLLN